MKTVHAAIKSLAVSYHAYNVAVSEDDSLGIRVWGRSLIEAQEVTGVELSDPSKIEVMMSFHQREELAA